MNLSGSALGVSDRTDVNFWLLPAAFLARTAAGAGLALINALGQIAGFVSPFLVGRIKDATDSTDPALYILSSVPFVGGVLVLRVPARLVNRSINVQ